MKYPIKSCKFILAVFFMSVANVLAGCADNDGVTINITEIGEIGKSNSGQATAQSGTSNHMSQSSDTNNWVTYTDTNIKYSIDYPENYGIKETSEFNSEENSDLSTLTSILFMNPTMAAGDLATIEPADLQLRIYNKQMNISLPEWLNKTGLAGEGSGVDVQPYRNAYVQGLKVCHSTMIAPGCAIYISADVYVYELVASSLEGEKMIDTFKSL